MNKVRFALSALALAAVLGFVGQAAQASFVYSVSPTPINNSFGGSVLTITAYNGGITSPTLAGNQIINLAQITQTSTTVAPPTDTTTFPLGLSVAIVNQNGGGSGSIAITGNINETRSDTLGAASTYSLVSISPPTLTLGNFTYAISAPSYAAPTIGAGSAGNGALSVTITETPVPEPATLAVVGLGAAGLLARRRRA